jgi:hypothetical protein
MDSTKINDWMQIIGLFALVASLIFVGLQMKQDQDIAIAGQYQDRFSTAMEFWTSREQSPVQVERRGRQLMERWGLPDGYDVATTAAELGSVFLYTRAEIGIYDNLHFQNEMGLLPQSGWQPYENQLEHRINGDEHMYRYIFLHMRDSYRESFIELCDELDRKKQ